METKYFRITSRPYESEANYCSSDSNGGYDTDKGTYISAEAANDYSFEPITEDEYRRECYDDK